MLSTTKTIRLALVASIAALVGTPLAMIAAIYITLSPAYTAKYLLYQCTPSRDYLQLDFNKLGLKPEPLQIPTANGATIKGFYFNKPGAPYVLLVSHGQGGLAYHLGMVKPALANNCSLMIYDYRGYGASGGTATTGNMMQDGLAAYDYLVGSKKIAPEKIILTGTSLGTGVAADVATKRSCAAVMLIAPYTTITRAAIDALPLCRCYPSWLYPKPELACLPLVQKNHKVPIVLIHGDKDPRISVKNSRELKQAAADNCRLIELKGVQHNLTTAQLQSQIKDLLDDLQSNCAQRQRLKSTVCQSL